MDDLLQSCTAYLHELCVQITDRSVGSPGNRAATRYFEDTARSLGWETETQDFPALDWVDGGASLRIGEASFPVRVSPYSLGCRVEAPLVCVSSLAALEQTEIAGKIVLLHGEIAGEQLMPKNFVFYNPDEHRRIIALLEQGQPAGIVCATGRNAALAGGVYPFPLIEDGDFDLPSVYMTEEEGRRLLAYQGRTASLQSISTRIPSQGCNVIARKGDPAVGRLVVTAHIDAKKGTPGALDNAGGAAVLLLLAGLLQDYTGSPQVELVAFNGEDYYAVPGQMRYKQEYQECFPGILLNINIDGAGYIQGETAFSFYGLPAEVKAKIERVMAQHAGICEGEPWSQGDHSIFVQFGRPALAVSSRWFTDHIDTQEITHTPQDNLSVVDPGKLVEAARVLAQLIRGWQAA